MPEAVRPTLRFGPGPYGHATVNSSPVKIPLSLTGELFTVSLAPTGRGRRRPILEKAINLPIGHYKQIK